MNLNVKEYNIARRDEEKLFIPLTSIDPVEDVNGGSVKIANDPALVGGKAASLSKLYNIPALRQHVPKSYALTTCFFTSWINILTSSEDYANIIGSSTNATDEDGDGDAFKQSCDKLKASCQTLPLNTQQTQTLSDLSNIINTQFNHKLAAVRSSAIEEDGNDQSYAGMFETLLGVSSSKLEEAVRHCFASKFDYRVFRYNSQTTTKDDNASSGGGFALVVMEMVDASAAGVSFSANPLNSDRDECVVDSSYGLGESVVDGSVTADRFIFNKIQNKLVDKTIGTKKLERRLSLVEGGGIKTLTIDDDQRQNSCSLPDEKLNELVKLTCIVEENYGIPIDIEWAITADKSRLVLLQARPITTLFWLDSNMMTQPGERRILYYDYNIASEATTTTPFTHMDLYIYCRLANVFMTGSIPPKVDLFREDPTKLMFNASTRQYFNLSMAFYFCSTGYFAKQAMFLDPYLASLFSSKDCDRKKYKTKKWPKDASLKKLVWIIRQIPIMEYYRTSKIFRRDPIKGKEMYKKLVQEDMTKLDQLKRRGYIKDEGLNCYCDDLFSCLMPSINQEMGLLYFIVLGLFSKLDKQRRKGKTEQIRTEYDALCGGFEGDELMEMNIAMYHLANKLDSSVWEQYGHENLRQLADRINQNLHGTLSDLPSEFLSEWSSFMDKYGFDGEDQLFVSSHRYQDDPVRLLARLRNQNAAANPSVIQKEQLAKRQEVMKLHEKRAASKRFIRPFALSKIRKRNAYLDNLMWIRNAPKLHISAAFGVLRSSILSVEKDLVNANRLEATGDVFHLDLEEVDRALMDQSYDLMALVRPRKEMYERALEATECPLLIDSRCRVLKPDPPNQEDIEEGVLLGAAISPGVATGRVRLLMSPTDRFEKGEVLAATVTSPAWTPLLVGASAIILQIGGALQHGALCAREFGKPAVSNIDVHNVLKNGMVVTVDGNAGTIKIDESSL